VARFVFAQWSLERTVREINADRSHPMQLLCLILKGKVDLLDGPEIQESPQDNYQQQFIKHGPEQQDSSQIRQAWGLKCIK
jgi:hypothetical protein